MPMFNFPDIQAGDELQFFPSALPDPENSLRFVPAVTCIHNGTHITLWSPVSGTYVECLDEANKIAQSLQRKYGTWEAVAHVG